MSWERIMPLTTFNQQSSADEINEQLKIDGAIVIENVLSEEVIESLLSEIQPFLTSVPFGWDSFVGFNTKRFGALVSLLPTCRSLLINEQIMAVSKLFLSPFAKSFYLNSSHMIAPFPGQTKQVLHRDRESWPLLPMSIEPQLSVIWALTDFNESCGSTRFALGSQNWPRDRKAIPEELSIVETTAGSVVVFSGSVIHGGGENQSNFPRTSINFSYCLDWLRAEENHCLSCPLEIAKNLPEQVQNVLGYTMGGDFLGYYTDPHVKNNQALVLPPEIALGKTPQDPKLRKFLGV